VEKRLSEAAGLAGLRVLSLESRRGAEMAKLIASHRGTPVSAPSMREIPVGNNPEALHFAERLLAGQIDVVILLTGVGTRILFGAMEAKHPREKLVDALSRTVVVARGPKPAAVLRELAVPVAITVPEPNTWRDVLTALDSARTSLALDGKTVAVQEYGVSNAEFLEGLRARGASVLPVPVYRWGLPEDLGPLRRAIAEIIEGRIDVMLVTSATQVHHLMSVASEEGLADAVITALRKVVIASIGPIATEALAPHGLRADLEPSHPKMGQLVFETAQQARSLLQQKRAGAES
jgi:uroporphyrinogen-III synthase